jgi:hypothetical protein
VVATVVLVVVGTVVVVVVVVLVLLVDELVLLVDELVLLVDELVLVVVLGWGLLLLTFVPAPVPARWDRSVFSSASHAA